MTALAQPRLQLALRVTDLEASIAFYSTLFGTAPAKRRPGYANFAVAEPPLKLVLIEDSSGHGVRLDHLGVEVASTADVRAASDHLAAGGLTTRQQNGAACCYAVQDKAWVTGPDGESWEVYAVTGDSDMACGTDAAGHSACCLSDAPIPVGASATAPAAAGGADTAEGGCSCCG